MTQADADWQGWWVSQAERLHWFKQVGPGAGRLEPAVLQVVRRRQAERLATTASTATSRPGAAIGSPTTGTARRARSATSPTPICSRDVQRFANALKDLGIGKGDVVGIYLPMIPEVVVAMLACARIGAAHNVVFGGFSAESVRERMEFSEAKALITVDGAARKGKIARDQAAGRRGDGRASTRWSTSSSCAPRAPSARCKQGRDVWYDEVVAGRATGVPGRADGCRGPAVHPLHVRLDREAEGHPAHHRRLPDRRSTHAPHVFDLHAGRPTSTGAAADVGWVTGHSYIVYGPLANGATGVMYEGAPDYPHRGHLVGAGRALQGDDLLHRADRDPRLHQVGRRAPGQVRPLLAAAARARSASRSTRRRGSGTTR